MHVGTPAAEQWLQQSWGRRPSPWPLRYHRGTQHPWWRQRGCGLFDPLSDMAEQKGYTQRARVLKRDRGYFFFSTRLYFFSLPFSAVRCTVLFYFGFFFFIFYLSPAAPGPRQWPCAIHGKNALLAMRVVSFFFFSPPASPGREKRVRKKDRRRRGVWVGGGKRFCKNARGCLYRCVSMCACAR